MVCEFTRLSDGRHSWWDSGVHYMESGCGNIARKVGRTIPRSGDNELAELGLGEMQRKVPEV